MFLENENGWIYDKFCNWVMFLIRDKCGCVIVFGGCVMGDECLKYFNLFEFVIYYKGNEFYGLY